MPFDRVLIVGEANPTRIHAVNRLMDAVSDGRASETLSDRDLLYAEQRLRLLPHYSDVRVYRTRGRLLPQLQQAIHGKKLIEAKPSSLAPLTWYSLGKDAEQLCLSQRLSMLFTDLCAEHLCIDIKPHCKNYSGRLFGGISGRMPVGNIEIIAINASRDQKALPLPGYLRAFADLSVQPADASTVGLLGVEQPLAPCTPLRRARIMPDILRRNAEHKAQSSTVSSRCLATESLTLSRATRHHETAPDICLTETSLDACVVSDFVDTRFHPFQMHTAQMARIFPRNFIDPTIPQGYTEPVFSPGPASSDVLRRNIRLCIRTSAFRPYCAESRYTLAPCERADGTVPLAGSVPRMTASFAAQASNFFKRYERRSLSSSVPPAPSPASHAANVSVSQPIDSTPKLSQESTAKVHYDVPFTPDLDPDGDRSAENGQPTATMNDLSQRTLMLKASIGRLLNAPCPLISATTTFYGAVEPFLSSHHRESEVSLGCRSEGLARVVIPFARNISLSSSLYVYTFIERLFFSPDSDTATRPLRARSAQPSLFKRYPLLSPLVLKRNHITGDNVTPSSTLTAALPPENTPSVISRVWNSLSWKPMRPSLFDSAHAPAAPGFRRTSGEALPFWDNNLDIGTDFLLAHRTILSLPASTLIGASHNDSTKRSSLFTKLLNSSKILLGFDSFILENLSDIVGPKPGSGVSKAVSSLRSSIWAGLNFGASFPGTVTVAYSNGKQCDEKARFNFLMGIDF